MEKQTTKYDYNTNIDEQYRLGCVAFNHIAEYLEEFFGTQTVDTEMLDKLIEDTIKRGCERHEVKSVIKRNTF